MTVAVAAESEGVRANRCAQMLSVPAGRVVAFLASRDDGDFVLTATEIASRMSGKGVFGKQDESIHRALEELSSSGVVQRVGEQRLVNERVLTVKINYDNTSRDRRNVPCSKGKRWRTPGDRYFAEIELARH